MHVCACLNMGTDEVSQANTQAYGWNSQGWESLLDECHQKVCTPGLLTRSVLIEIAWGFLSLVRNCDGEDDMKKNLFKGVPKK